MKIEILFGGSLAVAIVAFGLSMTLIRSMQEIDVMQMVAVEAYQLGAVIVGVASIILIFVIGEC